MFTILNGENVAGGLEVRTRAGDWIAVETEPGNFVVNIGDLLMRWTNDRWVSNTHRVANPPPSVAAPAKRLSIAFFHQPNYDALIECIAPKGEAKYPPVRLGHLPRSQIPADAACGPGGASVRAAGAGGYCEEHRGGQAERLANGSARRSGFIAKAFMLIAIML
jgi:hypothetical protein